LLAGIKVEIGSLAEDVAIAEYKKQQQTEYLKLLAINSAVFRAAELIGSALGSETKPAMDKHKELLEMLQDVFMPDSKVSKVDETEKARKIIEEEFKRGPFKVQAMVYNRKGTKAGLY